MLTITIESLFVLMLAHWFFDFFCQSKWMAENKSESWKALFAHTGVYSIGMLVTLLLYNCIIDVFSILECVYFTFITFVVHSITDAISSRFSKKSYQDKRYRLFFNIIGFDQLTHLIQLVLTFTLL
jgi:VIT1/CCC1 family predicted Fe2+/Mn2+ transporter